MAIIVSRAGIEGTDIKPDSPEWVEWFASQPEGTKIQFMWTDDSFNEQKFTAYRRKRYWEAQKRVAGKLRNTTIKPGEATYEALRQMGLKLTSYNWADKFEYEESGKNENYQTQKEVPLQTRNETEELRARIAELEQSNSELQSTNQALEKQLSECSQRLTEAKARINELQFLELKVAGYESNMREMHEELLSRPHPDDLIRRKVSELGMQEKLIQHQADPKSNVRYWALARLLETLE
jgi:predicted RNase H-like nuclease (RuvC/YqgF family)